MKEEALGLIEVIGFPPAVEAADSALKAANVNLLRLFKVDAGIVTVALVGDVGAIKAAVAAGGEAAGRMGTVRTTHVIARMQPAVRHLLDDPMQKKAKDVHARVADLVAQIPPENTESTTIEVAVPQIMPASVPSIAAEATAPVLTNMQGDGQSVTVNEATQMTNRRSRRSKKTTGDDQTE